MRPLADAPLRSAPLHPASSQVGDAGVTSTAEASPAHTSVAVDPGSGVPLVAFRDNTAGAGGVRWGRGGTFPCRRGR